ncbi:fungal specific transcription factor domain protein [Rutstroemia sp. NJR-2017a BVV2]|nr:fungal specific transcription factor domain protein [Rutstroemia sp. NJR-2017a BVV2]
MYNDNIVDERLKRYEALLREKGIDPNQVPNTSEAGRNRQPEVREQAAQLSATLNPKEPQKTVFTPVLLQGQKGTQLVDNSLWSRLAEEIHDADGVLEEDSGNNSSEDGRSDDDFGYILGFTARIAPPWHPPADIILRLWTTFCTNVDPLTKMVHVPSLQLAIEKAITNIERIPRGFEALMFAIYSLAVLSLTDEQCQELHGESREKLLHHYVAATKAALQRAKFMGTNSLVVLQALVFHILSVRDMYDARTMWSLTGVAMRVAEGMGMQRDGTLLGLSPFETEIRRRVWWQLKMHEFRAAELNGQSKFRVFDFDETPPKKAANVNDRDLWPAMPLPPIESTKPTEMIWCTLRSDLATFAAGQVAKMKNESQFKFTSEEYAALDDMKMKDGFIKGLEDLLETKYLRFCDPSQPLQFLTLLGARMSTNIVRFIAHHPRRWAKLDHVPPSEQQFVWDIAISLLEQCNMLQSNPQLQCFAWSQPYVMPWHVVIHVLDTIRVDPLHDDSTKAWSLLTALYTNNQDTLLGNKQPIYVAIGNLCLRAFDAYTAASTQAKSKLPEPPEFITKLRDLRRAAKAKKDVVLTAKKKETTTDLQNGSATTIADATNPTSAAPPAQAQEINHLQAPNQVSSNMRSDADSFWLNQSLDGVFTNGAADTDMIDVDMDVTFAQDAWLDTTAGNGIDWSQWDAWFGNSQPLSSNHRG